MNIQTIEMDPQEARERLKAYRASLHRSADEEYQAAAAGYEALANGTPLLQYGLAIAHAPRDDEQRPMLAVARADRRQVAFDWQHGTLATFSTTDLGRWDNRLNEDSRLILDVTMPEPHGLKNGWGGVRRVEGWALVPMVPPHATQAIGGRSNLKDYLILWEVEAWADAPIRAVPDRDPYLLRPLHGDLCAVVAEWDLTDLERAVMAGRALR